MCFLLVVRHAIRFSQSYLHPIEAVGISWENHDNPVFHRINMIIIRFLNLRKDEGNITRSR